MITYKNGIYQGQTNNGQKEGLGVFWWAQGQFYIGEWFNDTLHGEGLLLVDNQIFRAQFKNNKFHGLCINNSKNEYYHYEYGQLNGKCIKNNIISIYRRGELIQTYEDSEEAEILLDEFNIRLLNFDEIIDRNECDFIGMESNYLGCLEDRRPCGLGIENIFDSNRRIGIFDGDKINIIGQIYNNNDIYTGGLEDNNYSNLGVYYMTEKQKIIQGQFSRGKCVNIFISKQGQLDNYRILSEITFQKIIKSFLDYRISVPLNQKCSFQLQHQQNLEIQPYEVELDIKEQLQELYKLNTPQQQVFQDISNNNTIPQSFRAQIENLQTFRGEDKIQKSNSTYSIQEENQPNSLYVFKNDQNKNSMTFQVEKSQLTPVAQRSDPYQLILSNSRKSVFNR